MLASLTNKHGTDETKAGLAICYSWFCNNNEYLPTKNSLHVEVKAAKMYK
jgi:hypothetical protein